MWLVLRATVLLRTTFALEKNQAPPRQIAPIHKRSVMMDIRLFSTTAFRLTIIYAALFSMFSAVTLGFIYWSLRDEIESQVDARLRLETDFLVNLYKSGALTELLDAIQQRNQVDTYGRFYYLESEGSDITEGSEQEWPLRIKSVRTHSTKPMGEVVDLPDDSPRTLLPRPGCTNPVFQWTKADNRSRGQRRKGSTRLHLCAGRWRHNYNADIRRTRWHMDEYERTQAYCIGE